MRNLQKELYFSSLRFMIDLSVNLERSLIAELLQPFQATAVGKKHPAGGSRC